MPRNQSPITIAIHGDVGILRRGVNTSWDGSLFWSRRVGPLHEVTRIDRLTDRDTAGKVRWFAALAVGTHSETNWDLKNEVFVYNRILTAFAACPVAAECGIVIRVVEPAPLPCLRPPAQTRKSSRCASLSRCPVCGCRCVFSQRLFGVFTCNASGLKPSRAVKVGRTCLREEDLWTMRWVKRLQSLHLERVSRLQFLSWLLVWQKTTV